MNLMRDQKRDSFSPILFIINYNESIRLKRNEKSKYPMYINKLIIKYNTIFDP